VFTKHPLGLIATVAVVACTGCGQAPPSETATPPNVIIVLVDTLRADHMSLYGYERETTPFIDQLAEESAVFEHARAQAGCTFPSVNSMLTSRYAFDFLDQGEGLLGIPEKYPSIAEVLKSRGYHTIAVSASSIVRKTPTDVNPNGGFDRGFDVFDEECLWRGAECVNQRTLDHLASVDGPFFLYLHYMDPHDPYAPPLSHSKRFAGEYDGDDPFIAAGDPNQISEMLYVEGVEIEIGENDIRHLTDLYDEEIRYFDDRFERLIGTLRRGGLLDRSLLILTADHGEEFLEHGHVKHCRGVWDTLTRVPLLFRFPDLKGGRFIRSAVQIVDVVPTLLDYLGIEPGSLDLEGTSLRPLLEGDGPTEIYAFADQSKYRSADDGRWQLILDGTDSSATLFDLHSDPLEQHDLFTGSHPEVGRLSDALNAWLEDTGQYVNFDATLAASKAKEEELRALGYLQ